MWRREEGREERPSAYAWMVKRQHVSTIKGGEERKEIWK